MRPGQASKDERAAAQGERRGERTAQHHAPGAAIAQTLEACPGRNYEPISILKTGIFLTFRPLSNALKIWGCTASFSLETAMVSFNCFMMASTIKQSINERVFSQFKFFHFCEISYPTTRCENGFTSQHNHEDDY